MIGTSLSLVPRGACSKLVRSESIWTCCMHAGACQQECWQHASQILQQVHAPHACRAQAFAGIIMLYPA